MNLKNTKPLGNIKYLYFQNNFDYYDKKTATTNYNIIFFNY